MKIRTSRGVVEGPRFEIPEEHDDPFIAFSRDRGFDPDFLARFGVHIGDETCDRPGWYGIPYPHLSGVWHTRYRNPDPTGRPKYWAAPGSSTHLYNPLHLGPNADVVWFCEGEFDTLAAIACGIPAIGIPGVGIAKNVFASEWRYLFDTAQIVVAFDPDEHGEPAAIRLAQAFAPRSEVFQAYPIEYSDLNDWYKQDPEGMKATLTAFTEGSRG